jgi:biotin transport system substrate-specific component
MTAHSSGHVVYGTIQDMATSTSSATLVNAWVNGESVSHARAIRVVSVLFVAALTAAAAQVSVPFPFTQVPFTLQPMVVLLGGLALGSRLGLASQVAYLAAGIAGLPVFAASVTLPPGVLRLLGPTGGYLMAYPLAAFVTGLLAERGFDRRYLTSVAALLAGLLVIYTCGVTWLGLFARVGPENAAAGMASAIATGVLPFVFPDLVKSLAAAGVLPGLWQIVGRRHTR